MKWDIAADPAAIKSTLKVIENTMNDFILINSTIWKKINQFLKNYKLSKIS